MTMYDHRQYATTVYTYMQMQTKGNKEPYPTLPNI